jgi:hemoglobin-like flavoprotein
MIERFVMATNAQIAQRAAFIALSDEDRQLVSDFLPILRREPQNILDEFYEQVRLFPDISKLFGDNAAIGCASYVQQQH